MRRPIFKNFTDTYLLFAKMQVKSLKSQAKTQEAQAVRQLNNDKSTILKSLIVYYLCVLFAALLHGRVVSN